MADNYLFDIETAWTFPVIQYVTDVSYVEVRKASGIAYIILVLINAPGDKEEKLEKTLKNLGVPYDIHYIFGDEIANMINIGIVRMKAGRNYSTDLLDQYIVSDFEMTELGKKLFAEGNIPTGNNGLKKITVYYDLAVKNTTMQKPAERIFRMETSQINETCISPVQLNDNDVEMFIVENSSKFGFKKGEKITGYEHEESEQLVFKMEEAVRIQIDKDKLYVSARDKARNEYIKKYYSNEIITNIMSAKQKYYFPENSISEVDEYVYSDIQNIEKIYLPSQLNNVLAIDNKLSLSTGIEMRKSKCGISKEDTIAILQSNEMDGYAFYFNDDGMRRIIPGKFAFEIDGKSRLCSINFIMIQKETEDEANRMCRAIFLRCLEKNNPVEKGETIRTITNLSKCIDYAEQFLVTSLKKQKNIEDKVELFIQLDKVFKRENDWDSVSITTANELFTDICEQVNIDNFGAKNSLAEKLNEILKFNNIDFLSRISKNIINNEDRIVAYEALEDLNYSIESVLGIVNGFKIFCENILDGERIRSRSNLGKQCELLGQTLMELKTLTGINNPVEDATILEIDSERFVQVLATYKDSLKKLDKYKLYATESMKTFDLFTDRFSEIKDVIVLESEALKNPSKINSNYIEQKLKKTRYKDAICDLHIRLQYELNRIFNTKNESTFDLLSDINISSYLTEDELKQMHDLRMCRNEFQHPTGKRTNKYSEAIITEWCSIVEKLGGMENESRSKN